MMYFFTAPPPSLVRSLFFPIPWRGAVRSSASRARALARYSALDERLQQRQSLVAANELGTLRSVRVAPGALGFYLRWFNPRSYMRVLVHLGGLVTSTQ
ncbi:unnamed protein product [Closterium sp. Naga37s-1]|nr:unnamed protein product [Closterium sp. Naga37s-1]